MPIQGWALRYDDGFKKSPTFALNPDILNNTCILDNLFYRKLKFEKERIQIFQVSREKSATSKVIAHSVNFKCMKLQDVFRQANFYSHDKGLIPTNLHNHVSVKFMKLSKAFDNSKENYK